MLRIICLGTVAIRSHPEVASAGSSSGSSAYSSAGSSGLCLLAFLSATIAGGLGMYLLYPRFRWYFAPITSRQTNDKNVQPRLGGGPSPGYTPRPTHLVWYGLPISNRVYPPKSYLYRCRKGANSPAQVTAKNRGDMQSGWHLISPAFSCSQNRHQGPVQQKAILAQCGKR